MSAVVTSHSSPEHLPFHVRTVVHPSSWKPSRKTFPLQFTPQPLIWGKKPTRTV